MSPPQHLSKLLNRCASAALSVLATDLGSYGAVYLGSLVEARKRCHGFDLFDTSNDIGSTPTTDKAERLLDLGPEHT